MEIGNNVFMEYRKTKNGFDELKNKNIDFGGGLERLAVAVADDPAGLYYNPAGIVYVASNNLTASMNAFNTTNTKYKNVLNGNDWERTSSALLPNFFGITQKVGTGMFGFSYSVADSIQYSHRRSTLEGDEKTEKLYLPFRGVIRRARRERQM